ncbi:hypothetical protein ACFQ1M_03160 [Sungkyunkwania multivorans]|uniref:Yip1 domain-containing protein n=1 Tax=Sungkyunkwania multivorans TaxID=1173618 RepID=A0ABW3CTV1_9FLAO
MSIKEPNSSAFKKWLDLLQQESWQLELIISGFSIFGLYQIIDPVEVKIAFAQSEQKVANELFWVGIYLATLICIVNLLIHVVLRGLWVGALGLRYVSGEIEFEQLNYHRWFDGFLRKRIKSFDHFIGKLENYCSIMFAVAFLSIFYILSLFIVIGLFTLLGTTSRAPNTPRWLEIICMVATVILAFSLLLSFLDFLTLGFFKRKRWIAVWYYPIYRFYSLVSLSFLYRPLVYNFLDSRFGRRIFILLLPIYIALMTLSSLNYQGSNYFSTVGSVRGNIENNNSLFTKRYNYMDELIEDSQLVNNAAIPSKQIDREHLPIFILFKEDIEEDLLKVYPELALDDDIRGSTLKGVITIERNPNKEAIEKLPKYLSKLSELYCVQIDSFQVTTDFLITRNRKGQLGFETTIDLKDMPRGKHVLHIERKKIHQIPIPEKDRRDTEITQRDSIIVKKVVAIPFWLYPE